MNVVTVKVTPKAFTGREMQRTGTKARKKSKDEWKHVDGERAKPSLLLRGFARIMRWNADLITVW